MDDLSRFFVCDEAREELCLELKPDSCGVVIFGASGDLTHRKLVPAFFEQFQRRLLPDHFFILGCARSELEEADFRDSFRNALLLQETSEGLADQFLQHVYYLSGRYEQADLYARLSTRLDSLSAKSGTGGNCLYYLATPPSLYTTCVSGLGQAGLTRQDKSGRWARVVVEKPFGHDLDSSRELDTALHQWLSEEQIYRIDHYLGKETVQNIFILRFANAIFEPLWNRRYIDHVQITVAETLGVENRAGYYEQAGALRDMFQNHMLEMLSLVAMEPPATFEADRHRDEKVKLLRSIRPFPAQGLGDWLVRGQYAAGTAEDGLLPYRQEKGVQPDSQTETYVAMKVLIDNWRWQGVPFYLRSGKRMAKQVSEIAITFKSVPHSMFGKISPDQLQPNVLTLKIQPEEGMALTMEAKRPGPRMCMSSLTMNFSYRDVFGERSSNAYERLLLDCMVGDQTLFVRHDGAELAWTVLKPILASWQEAWSECPLAFYAAGSHGPQAAEQLLERDGRRWRPL